MRLTPLLYSHSTELSPGRGTSLRLDRCMYAYFINPPFSNCPQSMVNCALCRLTFQDYASKHRSQCWPGLEHIPRKQVLCNRKKMCRRALHTLNTCKSPVKPFDWIRLAWNPIVESTTEGLVCCSGASETKPTIAVSQTC